MNLLDDLIAEEEAALAAPQPLAPTPEFREALGVIILAARPNGEKLGFPPLAGRAARMYRTVNAQPITESVEGSGTLAKLKPYEDPDGVVALAREMIAKGLAKPAPVSAAPGQPEPDDWTAEDEVAHQAYQLVEAYRAAERERITRGRAAERERIARELAERERIARELAERERIARELADLKARVDEKRARDPARCDLEEVVVGDLGPCLDKDPPNLAERFCFAVDAYDEILDSRVLFACPACAAPRSFVVALKCTDTALHARCLAGCAPEVIAGAIRRVIVEGEERYRQEQIEEQAEAEKRKRDEEAAFLASLDYPDDIAEEQDWLIRGVLPAKMITILVALGGHGKSSTGESMTLCVASGRKWLGHEVPQARKTLTVQLEMTDSEAKAYRNRIARGLEIGIDTVRGQTAFEYRTGDATTTLKLDDPASVARFRSTVVRTGAELIRLDSLRKAHDAPSTNEDAYMSRVMGVLEQLRNELGVAFLVLVHANDSGQVKGAKAVLDACDHELRLTRSSPAFDSPITIRRGKTRAGKEATDQIRFRFRDRPDNALIPELVSSEPKPSKAEPELSERARDVVALVRESGPIGLNEITRELGASKTTIGKALDEARAAGEIGQNEVGKWIAASDD